MVAPGSIADWALFAGMLGSLSALAIAGHRWVLQEPPKPERVQVASVRRAGRSAGSRLDAAQRPVPGGGTSPRRPGRMPERTSVSVGFPHGCLDASLGTTSPRPRHLHARLVARCAGPGRVREHGERGVAGPLHGPGLGRAAPGHRSPGRRRRRVRLRGRRRRPVVAGRDGRRVRPVVRGSVRRRRRQAVPGRHPARLERRVRTGARRRGRLGERSRRVRDLRLGRRRTGQGDAPEHRLAAGVRTGGCVLQPGRPLGGRNAALPASTARAATCCTRRCA